MANTGVIGRIVFAGTTDGVAGVQVSAVDIDPITADDVLGTTQTDANGNFSINYSTSKYRIWGAVGEKPDIEVRIYGEGQRLLWETPIQNDVDQPTLNVGTIPIHRNNFRVDEATASSDQRKQDPYWLATHTSLDPANGNAIRLTRGNQIDWLVDGATMFPAVTDSVEGATRSVKLINMAFDAEGLTSDFDFGTKTHQNVEATDLVIVRKLGRIMANRAAAHVPVEVLIWELEDNIGGGVGSLFNKADGAAEVRKFFQTTGVRVGSFKSTQLLHVKLIIVDGQTAYVVGSTMKQGYFGDQQHLIRDGRHGVVFPGEEKGDRQLYHDVSLRVLGPAVRALDQTFSTIWNAGNPNPPTPANQVGPIGGPDAPASVQVLRTLPGDVFTTPDPNAEQLPHGETGILESYQRAIMKAEEFIYIEDQYFNSPEIAAAIKLRMKEKPALEVILVLNTRPDIGGYHEHQASLINELRAALGNQQNRLGVYTMWSSDPAEPRFEIAHIYVHSKLAIIDDNWASVGTANIDGASMNQRQWRLIMSGLVEMISDLNNLKLGLFVLLFPFIFLLLLAISPVLLLLPDIGPFLVEAIKKEFARGTQHANPNRPRQPPRHPEINLVVYNGIAGEPITDKVKELRESLWTEQLGVQPPATRPSRGWVSHWNTVAAAHLTEIQNAAASPLPRVRTETKILNWVIDRDYEAYLRRQAVKTKGIRVRDSGQTMPFQQA
jgi:phosphatidylserine/phosphatidylglycerophosphate/cardiolipin synthase-like enzyme